MDGEGVLGRSCGNNWFERDIDRVGAKAGGEGRDADSGRVDKTKDVEREQAGTQETEKLKDAEKSRDGAHEDKRDGTLETATAAERQRSAQYQRIAATQLLVIHQQISPRNRQNQIRYLRQGRREYRLYQKTQPKSNDAIPDWTKLGEEVG